MPETSRRRNSVTVRSVLVIETEIEIAEDAPRDALTPRFDAEAGRFVHVGDLDNADDIVDAVHREIRRDDYGDHVLLTFRSALDYLRHNHPNEMITGRACVVTGAPAPDDDDVHMHVGPYVEL